GEHRQLMQDRVAQARIYKVWNVPELGNADLDYLDLVSDVLSSGKTSRFYRRLVYDEQIATSVSAYFDGKEIGSHFVIMANARPGGDLKQIERALDEELARFLAEGPTAAELQRVKTSYHAGFVRGMERVGGFGGKSDILAQGLVYQGDPEAYKVKLQRVAGATAAHLKDAAGKWLSDGVYVLEVHPYPQLAAAKADVDRSKLPAAGAPVTAAFPTLQHATLSNGLKVVLAERHNVPLVNFQLLVDAGFAADQLATPGTSSLAMNMLDEGTKRRTSLQISEELQNLGAGLGSGSDLDFSSVTLSALKASLDPALDLYADVILNPAFPQADFDRLQKEQVARIQQEKSSPVNMALRVFPVLLYGSNHAYGVPFSGTGTEAGVQGITRDALARYHETWFKPNNATLIVVGDVTLAELRPKLEQLFQGWKRGSVPKKNVGTVPALPASVVYVLDKPGAQQSVIFAGNLFPPKANPDEIAIETMNQILGGAFTSRINMNLRENKHWSYGAQSLTLDARGQRPFLAYAPVQADKTRESMQEILAEFRGLQADRPATAAELSFAQDQMTLTLAGRWETMGAVAGDINEIVKFGLPEDHYRTYGQRVRAMNLAAVTKAAQNIQPQHLLWIVVGDRSKIEASIKELGLGEIRVIDADGKPVTAPPAANL
ncbi:MAG: insulinase family protein, partial [Gemmatimonadetes bacterium]|nr:insulinase family protein [Gemmatimonadota bacterium]